MHGYQFIEREMTDEELAQMNAGFDQHGREFGNPPTVTKRYGFVVMDGEKFIGCVSGLVNDSYHWFYLTDLYLEKAYRRTGLGARLLQKMEERAQEIGAKAIWTWTAGYEAPGFYKKQGYTIFAEMENWYASGHARVGLWKRFD